MSRKSQLKREIKTCQKTIQEIERRRSRSQSALVQAILLQEEPSEADVEWFNKYTGEITACRNHMLELRKELDSLWDTVSRICKEENAFLVNLYKGFWKTVSADSFLSKKRWGLTHFYHFWNSEEMLTNARNKRIFPPNRKIPKKPLCNFTIKNKNFGSLWQKWRNCIA